MKIFYDHHIFSSLKFGGISKYMCELLKNIPRENWTTSTLISNNQHIKESGLIKTIPFFPNLNFRGQWKIMIELNMPYTKLKLQLSDWDVFHATMFATRYFDNIKNKPLVVTIHDLIYDIFYKNEDVPEREKVIEMGRKSAERANKVIAVSQHTKNDIINIWGIDESKIEVIYHGVDKEKLPVTEKKIIENPYILHVGGRGVNKNFEHLVEAFSILSAKYPDLRLVCTGAGFSKYEMEMFNKYNLQNKVHCIFANNVQLAQLYNDAEMLVVPSYYEGFGMPILEAMVYDCPVVVSDASCCPEIAGDAGLYFNPYDSEEMSEKIKLLLEDSALKEQQQLLGKKRLENFSWKKCADEHLKVYKNLL